MMMKETHTFSWTGGLKELEVEKYVVHSQAIIDSSDPRNIEMVP